MKSMQVFVHSFFSGVAVRILIKNNNAQKLLTIYNLVYLR